MAGAIVTAIYRPHPGKDEELLALIRDHVPLLRRLGLATERPALLFRGPTSGAYVEVFEWASADASSRAHESPEVGAVWGKMMEIADFPAWKDLEEGQHRFPHFEPRDGVVS